MRAGIVIWDLIGDYSMYFVDEERWEAIMIDAKSFAESLDAWSNHVGSIIDDDDDSGGPGRTLGIVHMQRGVPEDAPPELRDLTIIGAVTL